MTVVRNVPLLYAGLAVALAVAPVVWFVVQYLREGEVRGNFIANDGWGVLPILLIPTILTLMGFVTVSRWGSRDSRTAKWGAWTVAIVLLFGTLVGMGAGPYFWPAAAAFFLATCVQQSSWWALGCAWLISLLLTLFAYILVGASPHFWPPVAVLVLATGTVGISLAKRR